MVSYQEQLARIARTEAFKQLSKSIAIPQSAISGGPPARSGTKTAAPQRGSFIDTYNLGILSLYTPTITSRPESRPQEPQPKTEQVSTQTGLPATTPPPQQPQKVNLPILGAVSIGAAAAIGITLFLVLRNFGKGIA